MERQTKNCNRDMEAWSKSQNERELKQRGNTSVSGENSLSTPQECRAELSPRLMVALPFGDSTSLAFALGGSYSALPWCQQTQPVLRVWQLWESHTLVGWVWGGRGVCSIYAFLSLS